MTHTTDHLIRPEQAVTLHGLFLERARISPEAVAYRYFNGGSWQDMTWMAAKKEVARWQKALIAEGLSPGDRVGLMLRNCPEWVVFDQAALSLGLVVVPLYTVDRPDNIAYIANDAEIRVLLFETEIQWNALKSVKAQLHNVKRFISLSEIQDSGEQRLACSNDWLPENAELQEGFCKDRDALATIIYTSGTTGSPKGVMLSHHNIVYNAYAGLLAFPIGQGDVMLSFLPLSHSFERTVGYYISIMAGSTIAFSRSIQFLLDDMGVIRPTILVSVPRIYERIYNSVQVALEKGTALSRWLFQLTEKIGWGIFEYRQGRAGWQVSFLLWPALRRLVADKVMLRFGGRLRLSISGGAPLPPEISKLFVSLGLPLLQGYGLTETSPIVSANRMNNNFPASAGLPLHGIEVKIGESDALLVRSPCNMLGYWKNREATDAMISPDGWLNTGDTARISDTGHIYITGRIKEIIVMSNGEKVPPADMQHAILRDRLFEQVMVWGEGKPGLVALAVLNPEAWARLAGEIGIDPDAPQSLKDRRAEKKVLERIASQVREFPGYARISRVLLLLEPWSIENGLLTPTLKLKRGKVFDRYSKEIEEFYSRY